MSLEISMSGFLGQALLFASLLASVFCAISGFAVRAQGFFQKARSWQFILLLFSAGWLFLLFNLHDFSIRYIFKTSSANMTPWELIPSSWAGQPGSLLLWLCFQSALGFVFLKPGKASGLYFAFQSALLIVEAFVDSPFAPLQSSRLPQDGLGLEPLLQTAEMWLHPPALFLGYALLALPFFALLAEGLFFEREGLFERLRPALWGAFFCFAFGNFTGGVWAHAELAWGGFWAWDPVENASLMPFLSLLGALLVSGSGARRFWAGLSFLLAMLGAMLTRSKLVTSLHSFGMSPTSSAFAAIFLISLSLFLWAQIAAQRRDRTSQGSNAAPESLTLLFMQLVLGAMLLVLLLGTLAQPLTALFGTPKRFGAGWYNAFEVPLGLLLLTLGLLRSMADQSRWRKRMIVLLSLAVPLLLVMENRYGIRTIFGKSEHSAPHALSIGQGIELLWASAVGFGLCVSSKWGGLFGIFRRKKTDVAAFLRPLSTLGLGLFVCGLCGLPLQLQGEEELQGVGQETSIQGTRSAFRLLKVEERDRARLAQVQLLRRHRALCSFELEHRFYAGKKKTAERDFCRLELDEFSVIPTILEASPPKIRLKWFLTPLYFLIWAGGCLSLSGLLGLTACFGFQALKKAQTGET